MKLDAGKILTAVACACVIGLGGWVVGTVRALESDQRATLTAVKLFHGQARAEDYLPAVRTVGGADCCFSADLHMKAAMRAIDLIDAGKPVEARRVLVDALRASR